MNAENYEEAYTITSNRTAKIANERGLVLNTESSRVDKIIGLLTKAKLSYNTYSCPCKNDHPICPCDALSQEINQDGHCRCRLFYAS